ncbi:alpha-L-rhamnosidase [Actinomyces faecalis]|uniref:alpha-L-rhamnosidase n=1 Tax=Actinomyces faecalis TaxID=2722820 RepID=UPI001C12FEA6|nr:alpha-L-rhamnosidase [Actinomyces faecalis]
MSSSEQVLVPWPTSPLGSCEVASVRVRLLGVCGEQEGWSQWSAPVEVEAALLDADQWLASFISPVGVGELDHSAPVLSTSFELPEGVRSARLRATGHGLVEPRLNGQRVDDSLLNPGWTAYDHRLQVVTWDVTALVSSGLNRLDVLVGNGWWRGHVGYLGDRCFYGDRLALSAQLEVEMRDGQRRVIATGPSWTAYESQVVSDDLYDGQYTDLRRTVPWATDKVPSWPVEVVSAAPRSREHEEVVLCPQAAPLIRPVDLLPAQEVWTSPSGKTLVDFGQNAVGVVRLTVRGLARGTSVVIRHAEVLEGGELGTRPLRGARATDTWILGGPEETVLEPTLTLHGLRYAEITGVPDLQAEDVSLVVIGSDMERVGTFRSSHDLLNSLHQNTVWSTRGNFVGIPTDCPQRDERLGWTGDIAAFAPTASFLYDTASFLSSWLHDLAAEQRDDGTVGHVVPAFQEAEEPAAAAWGDAAVLVPWAVYEATGDAEVLRAQLDSMQAWVDREAELAGTDRIWSGGFQYGDWLDPTAPPERPADAATDPDVVATACFFRSARVLAEAARVLGKTNLAERYSRMAAEVRDSFNRAFVTPQGRIHSDAQTAYAMAIVWELLVTPQQRAFAGERLADLVRASGFHIATGFVGTPLIVQALAMTGHEEVAGRLLCQTECPSWLYPVTMGATTIWERWDSMLPDGRINPGEMTSFNHYALGAVSDWLHRGLAGLSPAAPGWSRVLVRPTPVPGVTSAQACHLSAYGQVAVEWEHDSHTLTARIDIPVGVTADVCLPGQAPVSVSHGHHELSVAWEEQAPRPVSTVRELIDDPASWSALVDVMAHAGPLTIGSAQVAARLRRYLDHPVSVVPDQMAPDPRFTPAGLKERLNDLIAEVAR